jgi:hypothetical protein
VTDNTSQRSTKFLKCTVTFLYTSHSIAYRDLSFSVLWFLRSERKNYKILLTGCDKRKRTVTFKIHSNTQEVFLITLAAF